MSERVRCHHCRHRIERTGAQRVWNYQPGLPAHDHWFCSFACRDHWQAERDVGATEGQGEPPPVPPRDVDWRLSNLVLEGGRSRRYDVPEEGP